jgi:hypothetical protein
MGAAENGSFRGVLGVELCALSSLSSSGVVRLCFVLIGSLLDYCTADLLLDHLRQIGCSMMLRCNSEHKQS